VIVYLVPAGRARFELYSEPPEDPDTHPDAKASRFRRWLHNANLQWQAVVEGARRGSSTSRFARWRDRIVCHLAESIAEQRTLWRLGSEAAATAKYPAGMDDDRGRATLMAELTGARNHHLRWLLVDLALFIATGVVAIVPGPNIFAYYMLFRVIGHCRSCWGARRGLAVVSWTFEPDACLAELASLTDLPREARAPRVAAIAERLNLPRLSAFFDRVAVPSA
jgi:hypothetical protein